MKKILKLKVAGKLYQAETGPAAQVGDQVKMFLDTEANPELPEFVFGVIQPGIKTTGCCEDFTIYPIEYDDADMGGNFLRPDDVLSVETVAAVDVVAQDLLDHVEDTDNPHEVTKAQVGLGNVDNTSDLDKPISTATQAALNLKAPLASPVFTGNPTAPTPLTSDDDTSVATTAYVKAQPVVVYESQSLSSGQQLQARTNIAAAADSEVVKLSGSQTISGAKTFSTPITSTGTPSANNHVLNRNQLARRDLLLDGGIRNDYIRNTAEYFITGDTTSGSIGNFGWSSVLGSGASLDYEQSPVAFPIGRAIKLQTGATDGTTSSIRKKIISSSERSLNVSFYMSMASLTSGSPNRPTLDAAFWCGYDDTTLFSGGHLLVGWDTTESPNFLIKYKGTTDPSPAVIDTGIPLAMDSPFWPGQLVIDITGEFLRNGILGVGETKQVNIYANNGSQLLTSIYSSSGITMTPIIGTELYAGITNKDDVNKIMEICGVECRHNSGFYTIH